MIGFVEQDIIMDRAITIKSQINLLYVGRLVLDKGLLELLDATAILIRRGYPVYLNLVGSGKDYMKLQEHVERNLIEDHVRFHGMISDSDQLKEVYLDNDLLILPSYHEGFPRVLYEAMMMHLPIITTFVGSVEFLMKDGLNCSEIKPRDVNSIIEKVELLLNNPTLLQAIADGGTKTIINYLNDKKRDHATQLNDLLMNFI
nr:glycosyltransferase family 4 protein [Sphingobacterium haloxyli]